MKIQFGLIRISALILCLSLYSCDPVYEAKISNKSNQDIVLEIQLDKNALNSAWNGDYFITYFEGRASVYGGTIISNDTINWISKFRLKPNEFFIVEDNMGVRPDFKKIKSIHVFDKDTIILNSKEKMFEMFKEKEKRNFDFEIK